MLVGFEDKTAYAQCIFSYTPGESGGAGKKNPLMPACILHLNVLEVAVIACHLGKVSYLED